MSLSKNACLVPTVIAAFLEIFFMEMKSNQDRWIIVVSLFQLCIRTI